MARGTVLAQLDPGDYVRDRAVAVERLAAAEGRLSEAQADFELAKVENNRTERLAARNSVTQADVDSNRAKLHSTTAAVEVARREIGSAKVNLEQADVNLTYCTLKSPFEEATVASRYVELNERVTANQKAFLLLDLSSVVVAFGVPDAAVGKLVIGQTVEVTADAVGGERFEGVIHKIGSTADSQTRTYPVEVRIDQPQGLRPGMVATARFRREQPGVPAAADRGRDQSGPGDRGVPGRREAGKPTARQVAGGGSPTWSTTGWRSGSTRPAERARGRGIGWSRRGSTGSTMAKPSKWPGDPRRDRRRYGVPGRSNRGASVHDRGAVFRLQTADRLDPPGRDDGGRGGGLPVDAAAAGPGDPGPERPGHHRRIRGPARSRSSRR